MLLLNIFKDIFNKLLHQLYSLLDQIRTELSYYKKYWLKEYKFISFYSIFLLYFHIPLTFIYFNITGWYLNGSLADASNWQSLLFFYIFIGYLPIYFILGAAIVFLCTIFPFYVLLVSLYIIFGAPVIIYRFFFDTKNNEGKIYGSRVNEKFIPIDSEQQEAYDKAFLLYQIKFSEQVETDSRGYQYSFLRFTYSKPSYFKLLKKYVDNMKTDKVYIQWKYKSNYLESY